ncbi:MAG TPA: C10 family peptidase [Bacteroidia bacterium]|nr:C10 family peptidase [Bacteroidia bacterium]
MKKTILVTVAGLIGLHTLSAKPVTPVTAQAVAETFYKKNTKLQSAQLNLAYTEKSVNGLPVYYAFNVNTNDGFVIVTADDAAHPIIGYSTKKQFVVPEANTTIGSWLKNRKKEVESIRANNLVADETIKKEWSGNFVANNTAKLANSANSTMNISVAQMCQTTWNQSGGGSPSYNNLCPSSSVTGCVATAMAQIMKYWNYPAHGTGSSSYCDCKADSLAGTPFTNNYGTLSANYGATTYSWSTMPLTSSNAAVATLMYQCGVSVEMDYDPSGSGAWVITADDSICAQTSYVKYFNYNPYTIKGLLRSNYNDAIWTQLLVNELINGRVVQYVGDDPTQGGHTWVLDGVDTNSFFHMNWGWAGSDDGFYSLNNLQTSGGFNPSVYHEALIGIEPLPPHAVDAGVTNVLNPNQTVCSTTFAPNIVLQNFGSTTLTSCTLNYTLDNNSTQTQSWTGSLSSGQSVNVTLPSMTTTVGTHSLSCYTSNPNGVADSNSLNDQSASFFTYVTSVSSAFSANQSTLCFVPAPIQFTSISTNVTNYHWSFGDGGTDNTPSPLHTYTASGVYNVKLIASTCNGVLADTISSTINITTPAAPTATGTTTCSNSSVVLSASGSGTIVWQNAAGNQLGTGTTFTTPTLTTSTTYYAVNTNPSASVYGAPALNTTLGAGAYLNASHSLSFNANQAITLNSVDVYAQNTSAQPVIQLQDNMGNILQSYTPTLTATGKNTVTLNWSIGPGTGYLLAATGNNINLYRNSLSSGFVPYPYNIGSLVSITGDDVDSLHYYYFYNWQVQQEACASSAVPVTVTVQVCTGIKQEIGNGQSIAIYPNPTSQNITLQSVKSLGVVKVYNSIGQLVAKQETNENILQLNLSEFEPGVYLVLVGNYQTKIIKQ